MDAEGQCGKKLGLYSRELNFNSKTKIRWSSLEIISFSAEMVFPRSTFSPCCASLL